MLTTIQVWRLGFTADPIKTESQPVDGINTPLQCPSFVRQAAIEPSNTWTRRMNDKHTHRNKCKAAAAGRNIGS